jgi:type II secretory pathway pseudopilin PulG
MDSLSTLRKHLSFGLIFVSLTSIATKRDKEAGFSLVEATCAMVILLIALVGVATTFTYAINYNAGNNSRAQALAVLQQEVEQLRSAKFTPPPNGMDALLAGGEKAEKPVSTSDGKKFRIKTIIDDDPFTDDIQIDDTKTIKEITVTVTLDNPTPGWQTAVPATVILRRVRGN